jgi:hypothetical protein
MLTNIYTMLIIWLGGKCDEFQEALREAIKDKVVHDASDRLEAATQQAALLKVLQDISRQLAQRS